MNLDDMKKSAYYLNDLKIRGFDILVHLGSHLKIPEEEPKFTVPLKILGSETVQWSNGDYSVFAKATKYLATTLTETKEDGRWKTSVKDEILFDGAIIITIPLELSSPKGFKINQTIVGKIWDSRLTGNGYEEDGGLRVMVFGAGQKDEGIKKRLMMIINGYKIQELEKKATN